MSLKLKWKPKPIFYCYGNAQRFADDSLTAKMTGEPLPKTWQEFFELTPEQKAQWDAELKLDAEYRIAEAQGFPNGIPGGKERGNIFYFLAQREKEYKRECEEVQEEYAKDQEKHFSLRQKTDILCKNKWVMEYDPYGTSPKHEPMEPLILPKEDFLMEKIELKYDTDALNNVIRNAAAKSTPNVNSAASWWQAMDQPTYNFSRNIYDDYRQNDGETNVRDAWNHIANSSAYNGGMTNGGNAVQNSTGGNFTEDGRLGEVFVTKEGAEDATYFSEQRNGMNSTVSLNASIGSVSDLMNRGLRYLGESNVKDYFGPDSMSYQLSLQELEYGLEQIKKIKIEEVTGVAEKILDILSIVKGHPAIIAIHVTIGLCVVAQRVQRRRVEEKLKLEQKGWRPEVIKAYLEEQVPRWFKREALQFFVGNWIGGVSKMITEDIGTRVFIELAIDEYYDFLNNYGSVSIGTDQIGTWEAELRAAYREDGVTDLRIERIERFSAVICIKEQRSGS